MLLMAMLSLKLVAIAKDEAPYLAEWIFHHLYLQFLSNLIYIYFSLGYPHTNA